MHIVFKYSANADPPHINPFHAAVCKSCKWNHSKMCLDSPHFVSNNSVYYKILKSSLFCPICCTVYKKSSTSWTTYIFQLRTKIFSFLTFYKRLPAWRPLSLGISQSKSIATTHSQMHVTSKIKHIT